MKRKILPLFAIVAIAGFVACGNGNDENAETDTTSTTVNSSAGGEATGSTGSTGSSTSTPKYIDLYSGNDVEKDATSGEYLNSQTRQRVDYYYDPSTNDTFDTRGRVVNLAITRGNDGKYVTDESKLKVKVQGDGDIKIKNKETGDKMKIETDGDGKIKTDDEKVKVRDGEVKKKD